MIRTHLHEQFLENQILEAVKLWLEPLPDGSLPSLDIQTEMLDILAKVIHIEAVSWKLDLPSWWINLA